MNNPRVLSCLLLMWLAWGILDTLVFGWPRPLSNWALSPIFWLCVWLQLRLAKQES